MAKRSITFSIGSRIRKRRLDLRMSQSELADKMNTTQAEVSNVENGKANYTITTLDSICAALDLSAKVYKPKKKRKK